MSHLITKLCKEENREKTSQEGGRNKENKQQELGRRREQRGANKAGEKIRDTEQREGGREGAHGGEGRRD